MQRIESIILDDGRGVYPLPQLSCAISIAIKLFRNNDDNMRDLKVNQVGRDTLRSVKRSEKLFRGY
jgi:hypothetical protein